MRYADDDLIPVNSLDEIPRFSTEDEEHAFWSTHGLGQGLLDQMKPVDDGSLPRPRSRKPRFWHRIAILPVANGAASIPTEKPAVEDKYARLGRVYREQAA